MQYGRPVSRSSLGASYGSMPRLLTFENNVESSSKFLIKINIMTFSITKLIGVDYLLNIIAAILYATRCRLFGGRSVCNEMESRTDHDGTAAADTIPVVPVSGNGHQVPMAPSHSLASANITSSNRLFGSRSVYYELEPINELESGTDHGGIAAADTVSPDTVSGAVPDMVDPVPEHEVCHVPQEGESWMEPVPEHEVCRVPQWDDDDDDESVEDVTPLQGVVPDMDPMPEHEQVCHVPQEGERWMDPVPEHEVCRVPQWDDDDDDESVEDVTPLHGMTPSVSGNFHQVHDRPSFPPLNNPKPILILDMDRDDLTRHKVEWHTAIEPSKRSKRRPFSNPLSSYIRKSFKATDRADGHMPRKRTRLFNKAKPDPPAPCILKGKAKMIFPIITLETSNAFEQTARTY